MTVSLPSAVDSALESGPYVRVPGASWAFLDAVRGNWPGTPFRDPRERCKRWPEGWWLVNLATGLAVQGSCKSTNLCKVCRDRYLRETAEVLRYASAIWPPSLYVVLTAREHLSRAAVKHPLEMIRRWTRSVWPACEWFITVEMQKRYALHLNLLVRGVPASDAFHFQMLATREWCRRIDARAVAQHSEPIWDVDGVARYVSKFEEYITKADQQPRLGWAGHRTSQTRGFFPGGIGAVRELVRRRMVWRIYFAEALDRGLRGLQAVSYATNMRAISGLQPWTLLDVCRPNSPRRALISGRSPVPKRAERRSGEGPAAAIKRYVDDQRTQGRLFDPGGTHLRNRGPHTLTS